MIPCPKQYQMSSNGMAYLYMAQILSIEIMKIPSLDKEFPVQHHDHEIDLSIQL